MTPTQTPYELVFVPTGYEDEAFPRIQQEAEDRGVDATDPERFLMLGSVASLLRELPPEMHPEQESGAWGDRGSPIRQYGLLLFHGYHFWRFDRQLYVLEEPLARRLVGPYPEIGGWEMAPPHPAGYLQLPRHVFWARVSDAEPPEPVDGLFWTMVGSEDPKIPPFPRLDALLALGVRAGRPGFGVVGIAERLDTLPTGHWGDIDARPDGEDFANVLPGGELKELQALTTPGEVLKLLSRCFHYVAEHADALEPRQEVSPAESGEASPHALPPSSLPFQRLHEVDGNG